MRSPVRLMEADPASAGDNRFGETDDERALFRFQHAAICYIEAFKRHIEKQMIAVTEDPSFSAQDCMILHAVRTGLRSQSIPDIQHFLNRNDVANIQYGVKKLVKAGLIEKAPRDAGRGTSYRLTREGERISGIYLANRRRLMGDLLHAQGNFQHDADIASRLMMNLTGAFDHLSRTIGP